MTSVSHAAYNYDRLIKVMSPCLCCLSVVFPFTRTAFYVHTLIEDMILGHSQLQGKDVWLLDIKKLVQFRSKLF